MKKIAIISPGYKPVPAVKGGAVETLITYLIEGNEAFSDCIIDLYTKNDEKINSFSFKNTNIKIIESISFFDFVCKVLNRLFKFFHINYVFLAFPYFFAKQINKNNYDLVIVENNMVMYKKIYQLCPKFRKKMIYHMHNNMGEPGKNVRNAKFIATTAREIIFVSAALKKAFNKSCNSDDVGIVLYNVIDFSKYNIDKYRNRNTYRKKLNILDDYFNFVYTGRVCSDKGVYELVQAFILLNQKYNNVSLTIIGFGFGSNLSIYEKKILKLVSKYNVNTFGFMISDELIESVVASDCVVIPSMYEEAFGVVALEAMALKKTIISTAAGGLVETLDNNCAIIIERNDIVNNLFVSMEKLYLDRNLAKNLSDNAYKKIINENIYDKNFYYESFCNICKLRR